MQPFQAFLPTHATIKIRNFGFHAEIVILIIPFVPAFCILLRFNLSVIEWIMEVPIRI